MIRGPIRPIGSGNGSGIGSGNSSGNGLGIEARSQPVNSIRDVFITILDGIMIKNVLPE